MKIENETLKDQIELLERALREFNGGEANYEETYEAVLRSEFELMR